MNDLQLFDALPAHIEDALRASIRRFGVLVPIIRDQHGQIIDGHHRVRIADEEGIGIADDIVITVADEDEAREIARTLNADRRQLTEEQRRAVVADLRSEGHSLRAIAGAVGVSHTQVRKDIEATRLESGFQSEPERIARQGGGSYPARRPQPTPESTPEADPALPSDADLLAGAEWSAAPELPTGQKRADAAVAEAARAADPEPWTEEELNLQTRLTNGETVVVSLRDGRHARLISWADQRGLYVRIDRRTPWGNPFEMGADGDRATVIANYAEHYLPHKPSLLGRLDDLRGKALGCWCAPEPCHGDILKARTE